MDKHFGNQEYEKVAVNYWVGPITADLMSILINNSRYFDYIYLFTDQPYDRDFMIPSNVITVYVTTKEILDAMELPLGQFNLTFFEVYNHINSLTPAAVSDLICYAPKQILNKICGTNYQRVLYFDLNTIVWNRYLIRELFGSMREVPDFLYLKPSEGTYATNGYSSYVSSDWSLDTRKTPEMLLRKLTYHLYNLIHEKNYRYTSLGPSFINPIVRVQQDVKILPIETNEICPDTIYAGTLTFKHKPHSFGLALSNTLYESAGYKIKSMTLNNDKTCTITFENL